MKLYVITGDVGLYDRVSGIIQRQAYEFDTKLLKTNEEVMREINEKVPDIVLIDTAFSGPGFPFLSGMIRARSARTCVIVVSDDDSYAVPAFSVHATGYITKPLTDDRLEEELRFSMDLLKNTKRGSAPVQLVTEGNYDFFVNGVPARFKYNKTGEMLAHLIRKNGVSVSNEELISMLWNEDTETMDEQRLKSRYSYIRNIKADLANVLAGTGCEDAVIKRRGMIAVNMDKISLI